jgi:hypothetical protein
MCSESEPLPDRRPCQTCGGSGFVNTGKTLIRESFAIVDDKPTVLFYPSWVKSVCTACRGAGHIE